MTGSRTILRTAVPPALAADSPAGQAHVDGTSCVARLTPGQVTDLTCPAHASTIVVTVTLDDGARTMLTLG